LINTITGSDKFQTRPVSAKQNKGRHTTTSRELVQLDNGALLIDTPGMRELGNMSIDAGIEETFAEIAELAEQCEFRDCSHAGEKGCAVLAAIGAGSLDEHRYRNFLKMKNESAFHEMSYLEKRRKDKDFGKMVKAVMKKKNMR
jgi:ribosome biogenesis GTPase